MIKGYDVIGDTHGCADQLEALLAKLGYEKTDGVWSHPNRKVVFLGDYIDRGDQILETLEIVRSMQEHESAICLMGNHEMNAILYSTPDPNNSGEFLRPHLEKNVLQHAKTVEQLGDRYDEWINWFKSLPLWLELEVEGQKIHFIHACWCQKTMDALMNFGYDGEPVLKGLKRCPMITDTGILLAGQKGHFVYESIELLLKGPEVKLPKGEFMTDKDGNPRKRVRIQWWREPTGTYRELAMLGEADRPSVPNALIPEGAFEAIAVSCPTFIGHYWLTADSGITVMNDKVACLDYSLAQGGPAVAYRYQVKEDRLDNTYWVLFEG